MYQSLLAILIGTLNMNYAAAVTPELPPFLPDYYASAFQAGEKVLSAVSHSAADNAERWIYSADDQSLLLFLDFIPCDRAKSAVLFRNVLEHLNAKISESQGRFVEITGTDIHAELLKPDTEEAIFAFLLPDSIQIWTFIKEAKSSFSLKQMYSSMLCLVNRHRYTKALSDGNISMGVWGDHIYDHALDLFENHQKDEGLSVLSELLPRCPQMYQAHLTFLMHQDETMATSGIAAIILENAENPELIKKAADYLGEKTKDIRLIPTLDQNEIGLELVLIPLDPCCAWYLDDAARVYQDITGIPVKIRRLQESWKWGEPDRISRQRTVQGLLVKIAGQNIDFNNWTKADYLEALQEASTGKDAVTKYYVDDMIDKVKRDPGQYFLDPYLNHFCELLKSYRSDDRRTMYVGITAVNIFSGDNNYVFSVSRIPGGESLAGILSYHMMLADTLGEGRESQKRLIERIAKELIPASLKQLGLARSIDPRCPYSYSSGVERLDEKTLNLSESLKLELEKLKD